MLVSLILGTGAFGAGLLAAVVLDVKFPRAYDYLTAKVARFLLKVL